MKILNTQIIPTPYFGFGKVLNYGNKEACRLLVLTDGGRGRENADLAVYEGLAVLPYTVGPLCGKALDAFKKVLDRMSMRVAEGGRKHRWEEARQYFNIHEHEYRA